MRTTHSIATGYSDAKKASFLFSILLQLHRIQVTHGHSFVSINLLVIHFNSCNYKRDKTLKDIFFSFYLSYTSIEINVVYFVTRIENMVRIYTSMRRLLLSLDDRLIFQSDKCANK